MAARARTSLRRLVLLGLAVADASGPRRSLLALRGGAALPAACLFDFDGTLVDSEDLHRITFGEVLGTDIDVETWSARCVGTSPRDYVAACSGQW